MNTCQNGNYIEKITQKQIDGYDCSNPIYLASYQYTTENNCDHIQKLKPKRTQEKHYQILQRHSKIRTRGYYCEIYKTTKSQYCGTFSPTLGISSLDVTNMKFKIPMPICKKWFQTKELQAEDFKSDAMLDKSTPRKKLLVNTENIYRAFRQGSYLTPYTNDVNCIGT